MLCSSWGPWPVLRRDTTLQSEPRPHSLSGRSRPRSVPGADRSSGLRWPLSSQWGCWGIRATGCGGPFLTPPSTPHLEIAPRRLLRVLAWGQGPTPPSTKAVWYFLQNLEKTPHLVSVTWGCPPCACHGLGLPREAPATRPSGPAKSSSALLGPNVTPPCPPGGLVQQTSPGGKGHPPGQATRKGGAVAIRLKVVWGRGFQVALCPLSACLHPSGSLHPWPAPPGLTLPLCPGTGPTGHVP